MSRSPLPRRAARAGGLIALFALLALLPALLARPVQAQAAQVQHWGAFAVTAQVNPNSTFNVTEQQELVFDSGTFRGSFRYIPTNRLHRYYRRRSDGAGCRRLPSRQHAD